MRTDQGLFVEERSMVNMSRGDHFEELRRHLILALWGLFAGWRFSSSRSRSPS
jgi:sec-independent protein translocase protein TatC